MNRREVVSISGKKGAFQNVMDALSQIDLTPIQGKSVLIKPNIGRAASIGKGYNTHPDAIAAVIESMKNAGASHIAIGESPLVGIDTMEAFKKGGVTDVAEKYGVGLIDFDAHKPIKKDIENGRVLSSTLICSPIYEYDILVSVPVAKTHMHTGVTLGIKNMKGCLYNHEKVRYHQVEYMDKEYPEKTLDSAISDLASILLPDMTVIDGYIGMEGLGPSGGEAIHSDFCVASWHPMGADIYGCLLMGLNPADIPHLRLISERLEMPFEPEAYEVRPADFRKFVVPYRVPPTNISLEFDNVQIYDKESCSACLSTLMLFLKRFKDDMSQYLLHDGKFHIAIGKGVTDAEEGTIFVGNCTRLNKEKGIYVKGCPPVPTRIYEAITGREPDENEPEVQ
ncbi:MAG: DUF362 domain-containing protein [Bacteroidales bacterium]|nr:DUF362 domain-containing protein [Bacteroidales bacterium]